MVKRKTNRTWCNNWSAASNFVFEFKFHCIFISGIRTFHSLWNNNQITSALSSSSSSSSSSSPIPSSLSLASPSVAEPSSTIASLSSPSTASSFSPSPPPVSLLGLHPHLLNQFLSYQFSYPSLSSFVPVINPAAMPYLSYLQLQRKQPPTAVSTQGATTIRSIENSPHSQSENDSTDDAVSSTDTNSITSSSVLLMAKSPEKLNEESIPITSVPLNSILADSSKNSTATTQASFQYSPGRLSSSLFSHANYGMPSLFPLFSPPAKPTVLLSPTHFSYLHAFQPLSTTTIIHSSAASYSSCSSVASSSTMLPTQPSSPANTRKRKTDAPNQSPKRHTTSSSDNDSDTEKSRKQRSATSNNLSETPTVGSQLEGEQGKQHTSCIVTACNFFFFRKKTRWATLASVSSSSSFLS